MTREASRRRIRLIIGRTEEIPGCGRIQYSPGYYWVSPDEARRRIAAGEAEDELGEWVRCTACESVVEGGTIALERHTEREHPAEEDPPSSSEEVSVAPFPEADAEEAPAGGEEASADPEERRRRGADFPFPTSAGPTYEPPAAADDDLEQED